MKKTILFCLVVLLVSTTMVFAQTGKTISNVIINGLVNVDSSIKSEVYNISDPLVGQAYSDDLINKTIDSIDKIGSFVKINKAVLDNTNDVIVSFNIIENPTISEIKIIGNKSLTEKQLLSVISSKPGEVISEKKVIADAQAINSLYNKAGYVFSTVINFEQTETEVKNVSDLTFEIFEPVIGNITVSGNNHTRDNVLIDCLEFKTGTVFNVNSIIATQNNMASMGMFDDFRVNPLNGAVPGTIDIEVSLIESKTGAANAGFNYNGKDGLSFYASLSDVNIFGTGHRINFSVMFGGSQNSYQFSYTNPFVDRHHTTSTFNGYDETFTRDVMLTNSVPKYDERRVGGSMTLSRPIDKLRTTRVYFGFRNDNIKGKENVNNLISPDDKVVLDMITAPATVRALSGTITQDSRFPNQLRPRKGSLYTLTVENAGLLGGVDYTKFTGEARKYICIKADKNIERISSGLPLDWIYAARLSGGATMGNIPYLDQFMIGGSDTLRGYSADEFVGAYQLLLNQEIRIPVRKEIGLVGFVDIGDVWGGKFTQYGLSKSKMELNIGYGLGLRIDSPIGPLRFDYGFSKKKPSGVFTFGMGATF